MTTTATNVTPSRHVQVGADAAKEVGLSFSGTVFTAAQWLNTALAVREALGPREFETAEVRLYGLVGQEGSDSTSFRIEAYGTLVKRKTLAKSGYLGHAKRIRDDRERDFTMLDEFFGGDPSSFGYQLAERPLVQLANAWIETYTPSPQTMKILARALTVALAARRGVELHVGELT